LPNRVGPKIAEIISLRIVGLLTSGRVAARMYNPTTLFAYSVVATLGKAMSSPTAVEVVREFWRLMATNEFDAVGAMLSPVFVLEWPQSKERIRGAERFAQMNADYPAHGRWSFTLNRLVGGLSEAVSDVTVTDGVRTARAISFFEVSDGKITRLVEFWPEPYEPPENRAHLVERIP
jgi:ketosteroid isomerase-like protein